MIPFICFLWVSLTVALLIALLLCRIDARKARAEIDLLETENQQLRMRVADLEKIITYRNHTTR